MTKILLVEDDESIVSSLSEYLSMEGFAIKNVSGQKAAIEMIKKELFDIVLLDISLKDGNGFSVCSSIKAQLDIPVIFLTASGDEGSIVAGFELGADDYVPKPFRPRELVSRIKNALRKYQNTGNEVKIDNVYVDMDKARVTKKGEELNLSALEYKLLVMFIMNRGKLLSRNQILEEIWDIAGDFVNDNTLTVYIKRLREKIEDDPKHPTIIKTIRGLGYRLD
ncbi:DNA-binding response regulator, OmpR family, contains REC and winged-helix (wHTH) domain [Acetitomaculum ruminis DSM 5522]|uniref:Stage 0 sporulation protein A homolog n=1 Tax=Acetitomaculum ruminis DSM 5522 TaxID=1120918 RepID=A0A1I0X8Y5_9FIRM|nr:response regulator transcription factor [Acetitomaculum ruminis]SFA97485.1 DNA-binding response regulator, OmpR family, contains REC and winged-helix (wHTH) domain [Acetitomaculum ruminis DSM 5522]